MSTSATDRRMPLAMIRLGFPGHEREFTVPIPQGIVPLTAVLPASNAIADQEAAATIERIRAYGGEVSCRAGCGSCCRQLVVVSAVEAQGLADLVARMPAERQAVIRKRFADGIRKLEEAEILDRNTPPGNRMPQSRHQATSERFLVDVQERYFRLQIACPFLENESCSIYDERPSICRQYHVTSPAENCKAVFDGAPVYAIESTFHVSDVLGVVAERFRGVDQGVIMFILALEWSAANADIINVPGDGEQLFGVVMREVAARLARPDLEERAKPAPPPPPIFPF